MRLKIVHCRIAERIADVSGLQQQGTPGHAAAASSRA
jgi:hypothetical protein